MNKQELIASITKQVDISKAQAEEALSATIASIKNTLKEGNDVVLIGFGKFGVKKRAARKGINPQTKEAIKIPATKVPYFKPGKQLKELIKGGKE